MKRFAGILAAVLVVSACGSPAANSAPQPSPTVIDDAPVDSAPAAGVLGQLGEARARWVATALTDYRYVFEDDCGECQPFAGQVVVWDGDLVDPSGRSLAIDQIFDSIEAAVEAGQSVEAVFDVETGYPQEVWIDQEARAYDGGTHWLINDLAQGLPGDAASLDKLELGWELWRSVRPAAYEFTTSIVCDCAAAGAIWAQVAGNKIVDFRVDLDDEESAASMSPITIDVLFSDLADMIGPGSLTLDDDVTISGSADYDALFGYPRWVGLDIEVLDPESELASLAPRIVFSIGDFREIEIESAGPDNALEQAWQRWQAADLVNYEYQLTIHDIAEGSFGPPYTVWVIDGAVASVSLDGVVLDDFSFEVFTVDGLFARLQTLIAAGLDPETLFNAPLGYPVFAAFQQLDREGPLVISLSDLRER